MEFLRRRAAHERILRRRTAGHRLHGRYAGAFWEPLVTRLTDNGTARVLADGTGIKQGDLFIIARNDFVVRNPDVVETFLRVFKRGQEFIRDHPGEAAELIAKDVNLPPEQLVKVLAKLDFDPAIKPKTIEELRKVEDFLRASGIIKNPVDVAAFVDTRSLTAAGIQ
jgi:sulfonate transport system substrate-binding protein